MDAATLYQAIPSLPLNNSDRHCLQCVAQAMADLYNDNTPDSADEALYLEGGIHALAELLSTPHATPELFFEMEAYGHFKECYTLSPHFVIKFCARRNPTIEEQTLLDQAVAAGFGNVFLPSRYVALSRLIPSADLDKDDDEREIYDEETESWIQDPAWVDNSDFNYICIQLRAIPLGDSEENDVTFSVQTDLGWERSRKKCGLPFKAVKEDWAGLQGVALPWARDYTDRYGIAGLADLARFCETYKVWDLHSENVGYTADDVRRPIILDWMSR